MVGSTSRPAWSWEQGHGRWQPGPGPDQRQRAGKGEKDPSRPRAPPPPPGNLTRELSRSPAGGVYGRQPWGTLSTPTPSCPPSWDPGRHCQPCRPFRVVGNPACPPPAPGSERGAWRAPLAAQTEHGKRWVLVTRALGFSLGLLAPILLGPLCGVPLSCRLLPCLLVSRATGWDVRKGRRTALLGSRLRSPSNQARSPQWDVGVGGRAPGPGKGCPGRTHRLGVLTILCMLAAGGCTRLRRRLCRERSRNVSLLLRAEVGDKVRPPARQDTPCPTPDPGDPGSGIRHRNLEGSLALRKQELKWPGGMVGLLEGLSRGPPNRAAGRRGRQVFRGP